MTTRARKRERKDEMHEELLAEMKRQTNLLENIFQELRMQRQSVDGIEEMLVDLLDEK